MRGGGGRGEAACVDAAAPNLGAAVPARPLAIAGGAEEASALWVMYWSLPVQPLPEQYSLSTPAASNTNSASVPSAVQSAVPHSVQQQQVR